MLNLGGGEFVPYVKFNSKSDKWLVRGDGQDVEIGRPTFVADFRNIRTGWFWLKSGMAPQIIYDPSLSTPAPKPKDTFVDERGKTRDCYKRGFKLDLFSQSFFGGDGLVEFTGASQHVCAAISELYNEYEKGLAANLGQLPVVAVTGSTPQKDKHGVNYKPMFAIQKWIPVPAIFDDTAPPAVASSVSNQNSSPTPQATVEPPKAAVSEF